jgi:hypothetical protein
MPVIKAGSRKDGNVKRADYGASISLTLDESDPGQGEDVPDGVELRWRSGCDVTTRRRR